MKKKYSSYSYKRIQKKYAKKSFLRKLKSKEKKRLRNIKKNERLEIGVQKRADLYNNLRKRFGDYHWIKAPNQFSLVNNTEPTIDFINKVNSFYTKRKKVFIDLSEVKEIGHGAIVVLLSKLVLFKSENIHFNGSRPKNKKVKRILEKSGFFDNLYKGFYIQDIYDLSPITNSIYTHAQKNVDSELAESIIKKSSFSIWEEERRCLGLQRVLLELMQNTNNHASVYRSGEKHWWLSTNYKKDKNKVCFSFLDFGVGIFESLANKKKDSKFYRILERVKLKSKDNNSEILELLLKGEIHKIAEGKYFRGKGLPGIFNEFNKNTISNLLILSNDAYANLSVNEYKKLNRNLSGTFIYWELDENCLNIK